MTLNAAPLLEPKEVSVTTQKGKSKDFIISKFPAVAGREIFAKYPLSAFPKIGDYAVNEETMFKIMSYVAVKTGDTTVRLSTRELIDNHTEDWETLARVEMLVLQYNTTFFTAEKISTFFDAIVPMLKGWITSTLTDLSASLSQAGKQRSTNSKRPTR